MSALPLKAVGRHPRAQCGIADILLVAGADKRTHAAGFGEACGIEMHPGQPRERLGRDGAEGQAVAELAEHLRFARAVARGRLLDKAGEGDGAAGADRVPGERRARAEIPRPIARAGIGRDIRSVDVGGTRPRAHAHARIAVARRQARAPITEAAVEPGEDAAEIAARVGGIAVAVDLAPGADALRPEREAGRFYRRR